VVDALGSVTLDDVRAAGRRLRGIAHHTPVVTSRTLDARTSCSAFLKCENFQRMGAFKFRGAYNCIAQIPLANRAAGVVTFSSGNHAQGVALAGALLGVPTTIVMPKDAPRAKIAATRECGAEIVFYERAEDDRAGIAQRLCEERGAILVRPYDDAKVVAGQGTVALELLADAPELEVLLVCVGGGGLLSGSAVAAKGLDERIDVYGVEPEAGNDFQQSLAAGHRITIPVPDTIADGMQTQSPGEIPFSIAQRLVRDIVTVSDEQIRAAMRFAFERLKMVIEPSGAAALAALMFEKIDARGKRVGVTISGGNVDAERFGALIG